jgi:hypothetical protein
MSFRTELIVLGALLGLGAGCGEAEDGAEDAQTIAAALLAGTLGGCSNMTNDQVCICQYPSYSGQCRILNPTQRFYSSLVGTVWNDEIHSFIVGANVHAKFCQDDTYRGTCDSMMGLNGFYDVDLGRSQGLWALSSHQPTAIYVDWKSQAQNCLNPGPFEVALFKDNDYANFASQGCTFISRPSSSGGMYPNASFNADANGLNGGFGWPHDSLSSVILGSSVKVEFYKESQYGGGAPLVLNPGDHVPRLATRGFDEIISSIKVLSP